MYIGSTDTAIISAMTTHSPLPTTIGCSWAGRRPTPPRSTLTSRRWPRRGRTSCRLGRQLHWSASNEAWPADDAHVISVGGTDLTTASAAGPWKSETAWTDSGGGISPDGVAIPTWQQISGVINSTNKGQPRCATARMWQPTPTSRSIPAPTRKPAWPMSTAAPALPRPCGPLTLRWPTSRRLPRRLDAGLH